MIADLRVEAKTASVGTDKLETIDRRLVKDRLDITGASGDWRAPKLSSSSGP